MEKTNKATAKFCEALAILGYILLIIFEVSFLVLGICILVSGGFSVFEIFGMAGCFGAAYMLNNVRR